MSGIKKSDFILALAIGEISAVMMLYITNNLSEENQIFAVFAPYAFYLLFIFPIFCALVVAGGALFNKFLSSSHKFSKFLLVGGMNFLLDMTILNFLVFSTGIASGATQSGFKGLSFLIAVMSSFALNKYWTFNKKESDNIKKEAVGFFAVSLVGLGINLGVDYFFVNAVSPFGSMPTRAWAQFSAMLASVAGLLWNFVGYKFMVFDSKIDNGQKREELLPGNYQQ